MTGQEGRLLSALLRSLAHCHEPGEREGDVRRYIPVIEVTGGCSYDALCAYGLRRQVDGKASQEEAWAISPSSRNVLLKCLREVVVCSCRTVASVPDQPMPAKCLHIVVDSRF